MSDITIHPQKLIALAELKPYKYNVKNHPPEQIDALSKIIQEFPEIGFAYPIIIDDENTILAGHGRLEAAKKLGMTEVPYIRASEMTEERRQAYMVMENEVSEMANTNKQNMQFIFTTNKFDFKHFNMNFSQYQPTITDKTKDKQWYDKLEQADKIPDKASSTDIQVGDIFQLGIHRLMCGDCTNPDHVKKLLQSDKPETVCTDPPYSSGGRQEAHKRDGSIGSKIIRDGKEVNPKIMMDNLSTRAYIHLIKDTLMGIEADILYMFTDWRMWDWTREASEASGFPVRNMIVWDKQTPGMGIQWRGQHELICFSKRTSLGGPYHKGNVLSFKRSGNEHHPTEKPVALLGELIENTTGNIVYDPFSGSGSTLMTCEVLNKKCLCMELDPLFCDIQIKRWEKFSGQKAVKLE